MHKSSNKRRTLYNSLGIAVSVLPPVIATVSYFPIWQVRETGAVFSGFTLFVLTVCALPIFKFIKRSLSSASIWMLWLIVFITLYLLKSVLEEMTVISFVGVISGLAGAVIFKLAKRDTAKEE